MTSAWEAELPQIPDYRDAVIETLAEAEATLADKIVALTSERDAYRLVAQQAIHICHAQYVELRGLSARYKRLLRDFRALRSQLLGPDGGAA